MTTHPEQGDEASAGVGGFDARPRQGVLAQRTAIVHDWFQGFHGAERVVEAMVEDVFESPDIYTFHAAHDLLPPHLDRAIVKESLLSRLPGIRQRGHDPGRWRYLLPYMPAYFRGLRLGAYDVVVASSHACAVHARPPRDVLYVCYCYTPMRYAWLPATERRRLTGAKGRALASVAGGFRRLDRRAAQRPHAYATLSTAVRDRIFRFYGRESEVIHPPVDVDDFTHTHSKDPEHFLWVNRLVGYKRPDLVIEAFRELPYRLTMVGVGPLEEELKRTLPPNVTLRQWVPREELTLLFAQAGGFIHIAEEDFGISMVEGLAAGTPVIAVASGGALDIVRPEVDGLLLEHVNVKVLRDAVRRVAAETWSRGDLRARAGEFSRARFVTRFADFMRSHGAS